MVNTSRTFLYSILAGAIAARRRVSEISVDGTKPTKVCPHSQFTDEGQAESALMFHLALLALALPAGNMRVTYLSKGILFGYTFTSRGTCTQ